MRTTPLLALVVAGSALVLAACGDASGTSSTSYHTATYNDSTSTDPTAGAANQAAPSTDPGAPPPAASAPTPAQGGSFVASVDVTNPTSDLGTTSSVVTVSVTPSNGFTGAVTLAVTGLPAGVTAKFDSAQVTVGTGPITAKLTFTADITAQADTLPLVVTATAGTLKSTAPVNFKVNPQFTLNIPLNITAMEAAGGGLTDAWGKTFGATPTPLTPPKDGSPISVKVVNLDSAPHVIHGNGAGQAVGAETSTGSFPHGNTAAPLAQGGADTATRTVTAGNVYNGYLHDIGAGKGTGFAIVVAK